MFAPLLYLFVYVLLIGPLVAPCWALARPETRVEGSPAFSSTFASPSASQVAESHQENPADGYDFASGMRIYLYAQNDPVNRIDPSGHDGELASLMVVVGKGVTLAANVGIRALPLINRVGIILFEATTGNTIIIGGAGGVVALKAGTKAGGVGWSMWQYIGNLLKGSGSKVGTYKELAKVLEKTGEQANHLNQAAAFPNIPYDEGVAAAIQGSTAVKGAAHNLYHESLEAFWKLFRKNGSRFGDLPTNAEYDAAMRRALEAAGETAENVDTLAKLAKEAREAFKYFDGPGGLRPTVPEAMPLPK